MSIQLQASIHSQKSADCSHCSTHRQFNGKNIPMAFGPESKFPALSMNDCSVMIAETRWKGVRCRQQYDVRISGSFAKVSLNVAVRFNVNIDINSDETFIEASVNGCCLSCLRRCWYQCWCLLLSMWARVLILMHVNLSVAALWSWWVSLCASIILFQRTDVQVVHQSVWSAQNASSTWQAYTPPEDEQQVIGLTSSESYPWTVST